MLSPNYHYLSEHYAALLVQKVAHYGSIINRARLKIPDLRLQEVYTWSRINMEWLVRDVPGIGRGLSGWLHGVSVVVRNRDVLAASADGDRRLRAGQADAALAAQPVG